MLHVAYLAVLAAITKPGMAYSLVKLNASVKLKRAILITTICLILLYMCAPGTVPVQ